MTANELNELAGRIEGLGRVVLHLVARLEDMEVINGQEFTDCLRRSIVPRNETDVLMLCAARTLEKVTDAIDEARHWRRFRRQVGGGMRA